MGSSVSDPFFKQHSTYNVYQKVNISKTFPMYVTSNSWDNDENLRIFLINIGFLKISTPFSIFLQLKAKIRIHMIGPFYPVFRIRTSESLDPKH